MDEAGVSDQPRHVIVRAGLTRDDLMGSAPVRRGFETLLGSSVRRGSPVGPGMAGVYRVTRPRTIQAPALAPARPNPNPWIQGDDFELTLSVELSSGFFYGHSADPSEVDATICADLRDGISDATPATSTGFGRPYMLVQFHQIDGSTLDVTVAQQPGQIAGAALVSLFNAVAAGAYSHPTPPGGFDLEYEEVDATLVSDLTLSADFAAGGDDPFDPGGSLYWTNEGSFSFHSVAHMLSDYTLALTWPEQTATADTATIVLADALGLTSADQSSRNVNLHVLSDALTSPGSAGRDPGYAGSPTLFAHQADMDDAEITVTVRPPRHRFIPS